MSLFHYTDAQSVYSILTNKKLWLTDVRFSNDSQELYDGIDKLSEALKNPTLGLFANREHIKDAIEYLQNAFDEKTSFGIDEPAFVFSFTGKENLLSQWRAYGSYAIEFDKELLRKDVPALKQCIYKENEKHDLTKNAVTDAINAVSQSMASSEDFTVTSVMSLYRLIELAATFKHIGFEEEQEVRIITQARVWDDSVKYRPSGNRLIPYKELDISLNCIKSIHVGPINEQDLAYISMAAFVQKIGIEWQASDLDNNSGFRLDVNKSSIPYRAK